MIKRERGDIMRSDRDIAAEALRRGSIITTKRRKTRKRLKAGGMIAVCLSFTLCIASLPGASEGAGNSPAQAAVTMLNGAAAGGYVLSGVSGFILGAAAMLTFRRRVKKGPKGGDPIT